MGSKSKYQKKVSKIIANMQKNNSSGFFMQQKLTHTNVCVSIICPVIQGSRLSKLRIICFSLVEILSSDLISDLNWNFRKCPVKVTQMNENILK